MSTQAVAAGLIGLVVAGAGAVGVYNFSTTGCFLGSCSSETSADTGETTNVGLLVSENATTTEGDSCCPLTEAKDAEIVLAANSVDTGAAETCEGMSEAECKTACEGMSEAECETACDDAMKMAEAKDGCGGCGMAEAQDTVTTDAPEAGDG